MDFEPVIGLEVHVELKTQRKMFCSCRADWFGNPPNTHTCPVCMGYPGALPVPQEEAIKLTMQIAHALHCTINSDTYFERKHYFYPDLPKGYQISQYHQPMGHNGWLQIGNERIAIERVHLEEDTGKLLYKTGAEKIAEVDYNRSGVPLVEIVTKPVIHDPDTATEYLKSLRLLLLYLGVSDVDMEKGSMRCEPNISLRRKGTTTLPAYKVEVKNINSFRFVSQAINYELKRHKAILVEGKTPLQETRRYHESTKKTQSMRSKEEAKDYRYMPDPDIPPLHFSSSYITEQKNEMEKKMTPEKRIETYQKWGLTPASSQQLTEDKSLGDLYGEVAADMDTKGRIKAASVLLNDRSIRAKNVDEIKASVREALTKTTIDSHALEKEVAEVISQSPSVVEDYKAGNAAALNVLVGMTMRKVGRVDARLVIEALKKALSE